MPFETYRMRALRGSVKLPLEMEDLLWVYSKRPSPWHPWQAGAQCSSSIPTNDAWTIDLYASQPVRPILTQGRFLQELSVRKCQARRGENINLGVHDERANTHMQILTATNAGQ